MHDVPGVDAVADCALVDHHQSPVAIHVDRAPDGDASGCLDTYLLADRRQCSPVARVDVDRQVVVRRQERAQYRGRRGDVAEMCSARRRPTDVDPDADNHMVDPASDSGGLCQHSSQFRAIHQQIVRPLQHGLYAGGNTHRIDCGKRQTLSHFVQIGGHVSEQQRCEEVRTRRRFPRAIQSTAPGRLVRSDEHTAIGSAR